MIELDTYINELFEFENSSLGQHLKIELNNNNFIFEKYGLFDGCTQIISKIVNKLKTNHKQRNDNTVFTLDFTEDDFKNIRNVFFEKLIVNAVYVKNNECTGECITIKELNSNKTKFKQIIINIQYNDDWFEVVNTFSHELTHGFENYNKALKNSIKNISDIESKSNERKQKIYINAVNNLLNDNDSNYYKQLVSFIIYYTNSSERNAFISSFTTELNKLDILFDLSKDNIISQAYKLLKNTVFYNNYMCFKYDILDFGLNRISDENKIELTNAYNDITGETKNFNQVNKILINLIEKLDKKINKIIPKIICDYIDNHSIKTVKFK